MIAHHNMSGLELKNIATQPKAIAKINESFFIFILVVHSFKSVGTARFELATP